jgi:hypothetical protein
MERTEKEKGREKKIESRRREAMRNGIEKEWEGR